MASPSPNFPALQRTIAGDVVLPDSAEYELVRKPAIAWFDGVRPQAAVPLSNTRGMSQRRFGSLVSTGFQPQFAAVDTASRDALHHRNSHRYDSNEHHR
jgi:hypothetical protein